MLRLPSFVIAVIDPFAQVMWGEKVWARAQVLVIGAILATGKRTVSAVLRVMGRAGERNYGRYHEVLSRAVWSGLAASGILLRLLLRTFTSAEQVLVFGLDETIERRRGKKIAAKGIYRDPVRSSRGHFVKASGLRWISMMWLTPIPWAQRIWALPFFTVLAPSERYYQMRGRQAKTITDFARQMVIQLRHWLPQRALIVVGDSAYAALEFLHACQTLAQPVTVITRLRLDAALYEPAPPYSGRGRPRKKGKRLPTPQHLLHSPHTHWTRLPVIWYDHHPRDIELSVHQAVWFHYGLSAVPIRYILIRDCNRKFEPQALLSTDPTLDPLDILVFFKRRWQMEPTFQQVRTHLGVETQRQWSAKAIARTTPVLMALFSIVTLLAHQLIAQDAIPVRTAAWYPKPLPTFSDALALVRQRLWRSCLFQTSQSQADVIEIPRDLFDRFTELLAYAA
jgi:hypothetical protein